MSRRIITILLFSFLFYNTNGQEIDKKAELESLFLIFDSLINVTPDSALKLSSKLEMLLANDNDIIRLAQLYRSISLVCRAKSDYLGLIEFGNKSIELYRELGDSLRVAFNYNELAYAHQHLGHRKQSLEFLLQSLQLRKLYGSPEQYSVGLHSLGNYFMEIGEYEKCERYYLEAIKIMEDLGDISRLSDIYHSMGVLSGLKKDYEKSLEFYEIALGMYEELGEESQFPGIWYALGYNFFKQGEFSKAKAYFLRADNSTLKVTDRYGFCYNLLMLSTTELKLKNYQGALKYVREADELANEIGALSYSKEAQSILNDIFLELGDYEQAYQSLQLYRKLSDSLYSIDKENTVKELTIKYETELKEQEIEKLSSEKELQEKEILLATTEKNAYMIAVVFAIALALAILAFFTQRQKAMQLRSEKALAERNTQINSLLQEQEVNTLSALLEGQEKERLRIAEELHDRLGSLLSAIKLNFNGWIGKRDLSQDEVEDYSAKTSGLLDEAVTEVRRVSHNLSTGQVSRYGLVGSMEDLAATVNRSDSIKMKVLHFNLGERLPIELETGIYRIVQEMLANVLKHANAKEFTVQLSKTDNSVILTAEDDGKGFDYKEARKRGGIGLHNIDNRVKKFGGQFSVDSSPGKGTIFTFEFPLEA
ncbi:MAG: ATP-binding protein [Imperialibacter sp.]|uniref:tetratricopeptide repeat-containing sensor histidine kinase n=1 Tax=Imperialibacter sp. TaxID=2038411 RepID=UPI0032EB9A70